MENNTIMNEILKEARKKYPKGTLFISASGNIKSPLQVSGTIKIAENYPRTIVAESGGIIAIISKNLQEITWAEIV